MSFFGFLRLRKRAIDIEKKITALHELIARTEADKKKVNGQLKANNKDLDNALKIARTLSRIRRKSHGN